MSNKSTVIYKNKDWLFDKYWNKQLSIYKIGKICGCSGVSISNQMKKFDIPRRSLSDAEFIWRGNKSDLPYEAIEFINGELLGDGCLYKQSNYSALYSHSSKYEDYLSWLFNSLKRFGINQAGNINKWDGQWGINYCAKSLCYPELLHLHKQWYVPYKIGIHGNIKNRKTFKIIPKDIELTSLVCRQWYIGDGTLDHSKKRRDAIKLSTLGFLKEDVLFLANLLNEIGIKSHRTKNNGIYISTHSTKDFLDYIGPCPEEIENIYGYKWEYKKKC